jgi:hypothetical protein
VSIELDMAIETLDTIESDYADYADLLRDVASNLAATLGIDPERVEVIAITGGSVVVEFYVYPDEDGSEFRPEDVAAHFADAQTVTLPALDYTGNVILGEVTTVEWTTDPCGYYTSNIGPDGCEDNGCSWNYDLEECYTPSTCEEITDSTQCMGNDECIWDDWDWICYTPSACEDLTDSTTCQYNGCNWDDNHSSCSTPASSPGACPGESYFWRFPEETSDPNDACTESWGGECWDEATGECIPATCEDLTDSTTCQDSGCNWDDYYYSCSTPSTAEPYYNGTGMGPSAEPHHDPGTGMGPSAEPYHNGTGMGPSAEPHHDPGTGMGPSAEPGQEAPAHDCALYPDDDGLCGPAGLGCYDNCDAFGDGRCYQQCPCSCP